MNTSKLLAIVIALSVVTVWADPPERHVVGDETSTGHAPIPAGNETILRKFFEDYPSELDFDRKVHKEKRAQIDRQIKQYDWSDTDVENTLFDYLVDASKRNPLKDRKFPSPGWDTPDILQLQSLEDWVDFIIAKYEKLKQNYWNWEKNTTVLSVVAEYVIQELAKNPEAIPEEKLQTLKDTLYDQYKAHNLFWADGGGSTKIRNETTLKFSLMLGDKRAHEKTIELLDNWVDTYFPYKYMVVSDIFRNWFSAGKAAIYLKGNPELAKKAIPLLDKLLLEPAVYESSKESMEEILEEIKPEVNESAPKRSKPSS